MGPLRAFYEAEVGRGLRRDPAQVAVVDRLENLRAELTRSRRSLSRLLGRRAAPRGVYLWGDVGRGKSMLVDGLMETLGDVPARRRHFHAFMRDTHRALHAARQAGKDDPLHHAADREVEGLALLALDEIEIADIVDAMIVGRIFGRVIERGVTLVATSNRAPSDLYRDELKRDLFLPFVRLVEDRLDVLHLTGGRDYRVRDDAVPDLYLTPSDGDVKARIDAIWAGLGEESAGPVTFGASGDIRRKGAAHRAPFDALCRRQMAPASYLDLAKAVRVLVLDSVPRLGERDHDAARRFILLIDTLYDARSGLVVGAEAAPEEIYRSGEFGEEFRRTVSRLHEMTRPGWPGRPDVR